MCHLINKLHQKCPEELCYDFLEFGQLCSKKCVIRMFRDGWMKNPSF